MATTTDTLNPRPIPRSLSPTFPLYVVHVDDEIVHDVIDGTLYSVAPGEVFEFTNRFYGRKFLEHKWMHGIVEVEVVRDNTGFHFLLKEALVKAKEALEVAERQYVDHYIESQHQDRLMAGRPALRPSARQQRKIKKHQVNLEDYGIKPLGTASQGDKMLQAVMEQNQLIMSLLAATLSGGKIEPALVKGLGKVAVEPEPDHTDTHKPIPAAPPPTSNPTVQSLPQATPEFIDRGEPEPIELGPEGELPVPDEFAGGDPNDPNSVPGPAISLPDDKADDGPVVQKAKSRVRDRAKVEIKSAR